MSTQKRINLSFNEDEFKTQEFKQDKEEREILADAQLTTRLKNAVKRAKSGQVVKKSKSVLRIH